MVLLCVEINFLGIQNSWKVMFFPQCVSQVFHGSCFQKAHHVPDAAQEAHQDLFKAPPEWKGWQEKQIEEQLFASQGIKIRRRPFTGPPQHYVGPFEFRLQNEGNTARNILEEIIWNKDSEVTQVLFSETMEDILWTYIYIFWPS